MAEEAFSLHYITRLGEDVMDPNPKKVSIYVSYCPKDLEQVRRLAKRILAKNSAIIYFRRYDLDPNINFEDLKVMISQSQVTVILVTPNYLIEGNKEDDYHQEFTYLKSSHIPFLPIITIGVSQTQYEKTFGTIQYLDLDQHDATQISIDKKLENYFKLYIIQDDDYMVAKSAFKNYVFLSYRKKDRAEALKLIDEIHKNEECQDIAIWYDEFLVAGEAFEKKLERKLKKSSALLLCVTPNLVNEDNYVRKVEYKYAHEVHKTVLPIKAVDTSLSLLKQTFVDIPDPVDLTDAPTYLINITKVQSKKTTARKMYALGLAYLFGIEVEINRSIALSYLKKAAEKGYLDALRYLIDMYYYGNGVIRDFEKAALYEEMLAERLKKGVSFDIYDNVADDYYSEKANSATYGMARGTRENFKNIQKVYEELKQFKKIDPDYALMYWLLRMSLQSSLVMLSLPLGLPVDAEPFIDDLEQLKKYDEDSYRLFYFNYVNWFIVSNDGDCLWSGEKLYQYYMDEITYLSDYQQEPFLALMTTLIQKIPHNKKLSLVQKNAILNRIKEEVKKFPDDIQIDQALLTLQVAEVIANCNNANYPLFDELKKLEQMVAKYHPLSLNDGTLYATYHVLVELYDDNEEKKNFYINKTLEAISNLSSDLRNSKEVIGIEINLKRLQLENNDKYTPEERINEYRKLFEQAKEIHNSGVMVVLASKLLSDDYRRHDLDQYDLDYQDFLDAYLHSARLVERKIRYDLLYHCLKEDKNAINIILDKYFNEDQLLYGPKKVDHFCDLLLSLNELLSVLKKTDFEKEVLENIIHRVHILYEQMNLKDDARLLVHYLNYIRQHMNFVDYFHIKEEIDSCVKQYQSFIENCSNDHDSIDELTNEYTSIVRSLFRHEYKQNKEEAKQILLNHVYYGLIAFSKAKYEQFRWGDLGKLYGSALSLEVVYHEVGHLEKVIRLLYQVNEFLDAPYYAEWLFSNEVFEDELDQLVVSFIEKCISLLVMNKSDLERPYYVSGAIFEAGRSYLTTNNAIRITRVYPLFIKKYEDDPTYAHFVYQMKIILLLTKNHLKKDESLPDQLKEVVDEHHFKQNENSNIFVYNWKFISFFDQYLPSLEGETKEIIFKEICFIFDKIIPNKDLLDDSVGKLFCDIYRQAIEVYLPHSDPLFISRLEDNFKILDERYKVNKPDYYLRLKVSFSWHYFTKLLQEGNKHKLLMEFYSLLTYLGLSPSLPIKIDLSNQFMDVLALGMKVDNEYVHSKDSTQGLYQIGRNYINYCLGKAPLESLYQYLRTSKELGVLDPVLDPLIEISNPNQSSIEEMMKSYQTQIDNLIKVNAHPSGIIYFLKEYFSYLNKHFKEVDDPLIKEEFKVACERLSFYYEKNDQPGEAFEYQELSKKYR